MAVQLGRLEVETADHVVLRYDVASAGNRGLAALVDFLVATLVFAGSFVTFSFVAALVGPSAQIAYGAVVLLTFLVAWSYFIVLEWLWNGQTIGKRLYGLRVIGEDGAPVRFTAVFVRNVLRIADFLPAFYGVGLIVIFVTSTSQRLGDLAAGTYVVRAPRPQLDYFSLRTFTPLAPGASAEVRSLPGEAQRLVREFVVREAKLAPADRARVAREIAARVRPYAADAGAITDDVEFLRAVARSLRASGGDR